MSDLASMTHSRKRFIRWAAIAVPSILLLGLSSGKLAGSGDGNPWFEALAKPMSMPPAWVFPVAWSALYVFMGVALALILSARDAKGRGVAILLFIVQLALNLAWSPVFFALHKIMLAFGLIVAMLLWAGLTTLIFWNIRRAAALLMLPYLAWLSFAALLNWQIHMLNPRGVTLVPSVGDTQIIVQ